MLKKGFIFIFFVFAQTSLLSQVLFEPEGGEIAEPISGNCLSNLDYVRIENDIKFHVDSLKQAGILSNYSTEATVLLDWPLKKQANFNWNSYYRITNYIDRDSTTALLDYHCDQRTYDGHRGTDIALWPFSWHMVNNDLVEIVASADGVIVQKYDGEPDDNCSWNAQNSWNAVFVRHSDGSTAWYGHMKNNSLTNKLIGQTVVKGEYLGVVASSGISTGPHLHFELRDSLNKVVDPWGGNCNSSNSSCWSMQKQNREPTINALLTHDTIPVHGCPSINEIPYFQNLYFPDDTIHCAAYYHDQLQGDTTFFRLRRPDNSVFTSWYHVSPNTYTSSWWRWKRVITSSEPFGLWKLEADFNGQTVVHSFNFGTLPASTQSSISELVQLKVVPNPVSKNAIINLVVERSANYTVDVFNVQGIKIQTVFASFVKTNTPTIIKWSHLNNTPGIYFVVLRRDGIVVGTQSILMN